MTTYRRTRRSLLHYRLRRVIRAVNQALAASR